MEEEQTITSEEQYHTEQTISKFVSEPYDMDGVRLARDAHIAYLRRGLIYLSSGWTALDASRPWLLYWILHSLDLLAADDIIRNTAASTIDFLRRCQHPDGGFGGGPGQLPHLAPTYAAVNALTIVGSFDASAYDAVDRTAMVDFLLRMKNPNGSFKMHEDGETDIRGMYTALSVADMLGVDLHGSGLSSGCAAHIHECQTYEGGFGAFPGNEAHGGYAFCALAAAMLLDETDTALDLDLLMHWCAERQMTVEGGFQGRTNKLVDACYSFWMGGTFPLINALLTATHARRSSNCTHIYDILGWKPSSSFRSLPSDAKHDDEGGVATIEGGKERQDISPLDKYLFDEKGLQEYLLLACQADVGGLRDKPPKYPDFYHTCYGLSGLSIAQHGPDGRKHVLGHPSNELRETDVIHNVVVGRADSMKKRKYNL